MSKPRPSRQRRAAPARATGTFDGRYTLPARPYPTPGREPEPAREPRDRGAQRRRLGALKRVAIGAAVVAFGGGVALVGRNAVGVTSTASAATGGGGITTTNTSGSVPGLGQPDSQGYFAFQSGFANSSSSGASASSATTSRPSMRSYRS